MYERAFTVLNLAKLLNCTSNTKHRSTFKLKEYCFAKLEKWCCHISVIATPRQTISLKMTFLKLMGSKNCNKISKQDFLLN